MTRRRKIPLTGPDWMPFPDAHKLLSQQTASTALAARDLTEAVATDEVRCLRRKVNLRLAGPDRELLSPKFWIEHELGDAGGIRVRQHKGPGGPFVHGWTFYVWAPEFKEYFSIEDDATPKGRSARKKSEEAMGSSRFNWQALRVEIVRRCWRRGQYIGPNQPDELTEKLQDWYKRKFKQDPPNFDDLRKFVGNGILLLKLIK